jgi:hypothetical protein
MTDTDAVTVADTDAVTDAGTDAGAASTPASRAG